MSAVVVSLLCIMIYAPLDESKAGVQNRNGALFFVCTNSAFGAMSNITLVFPIERPIFLREVNNGMYRVSSYFWAKILSELPMAIVLPFFQGAMTFYGIGFNNSEWYNFPCFVGIFFLTYNAFGSFGYVLGASIANKELVNILMPLIVVPMMLFTGFFIN